MKISSLLVVLVLVMLGATACKHRKKYDTTYVKNPIAYPDAVQGSVSTGYGSVK
ncbi:MAG: hypothetical protein AAGC68_02395 [Verrucomicrobiota bacterium]